MVYRKLATTKTLVRIASLAREHTEEAIKMLYEIMTTQDMPPHTRVRAAEVLLDRGWGKPTQHISAIDDPEREGVRKIIREIVFVKALGMEPPEESEGEIIEGEAVELPPWSGNGQGFGHG